MGIQAVIFDIGNVLIEWNPEQFYDAEIGEERRKALFEQVDLHGMNDRVDRGEDFRRTVHDTAEAHPDHGEAIRLWHDRWIEMASPAIDQSVRLLRRLRANGVPVFALSNFGIDTFAQAETAYDFLGEFDRRYISGHKGVIKPDPAFYRMVEEDCGLPPEALLFTDDRADNIAMASSRGWQTHLFRGPQGWADRLVSEGLLAREQAA
ncbi:HAD-superfamily hydrolase, subfamily IA, variant 1 family protein [Pseudooceanicola batsensis HTCC2597]|uniref:HAD-superfamily hydrolase, subfamily IA, variant 1 family protein n=1 Tax=Pseudooceanicola batsensis (strain ATCC BAA-863 / DSM 15984 / KCTC 12145 / HTCC2597) TaxID=252305 RepID=A3TVT6_PSEBH|nr:HAD family phosphatase [Pseudooceanicola batsensis]EAQ03732.1 HAD-superfamily hydrolase, subfamily IA, variant 1 family protein [Pseudooceanicola batsensis HTCC2597]